jgi:hypothetical protein
VQRLRQHLSRLAFSNKADVAEVFGEYLTWRELIHTTYFHHPGFVKLIAYTMTRRGDLRPSERFQADADFASVERWYAHIASPGEIENSVPQA